MDQLLSYGGDIITEQQVQAVRGTIPGQAIIDLVDFLAGQEIAEGLALINQLAAEGVDLRQLVNQLVSHLRAVLLARVGGQHTEAVLTDLSAEQLAAVTEQAKQLETATLSRAIRLINQAGLDMRDAAYPQLALELAWLESLQPSVISVPAGDIAHPPAAGAAGQAASSPSPWGPSSPPVAQPSSPSSPAKPAAERPKPAAVALPRAGEPVPDDEVVSTLRQNWTPFLQAAEAARGGSLRGALRTLREVVARGDNIYFAVGSKFSHTTIERSANKQALEGLLEQLLGRPVHLHCQTGTKVTMAESVSEAEPPPREQAMDPAPDKGMADDPVVQHARENLGAVSSTVDADAA
jgi:DNA polymerase-3 subunit gamma/tau